MVNRPLTSHGTQGVNAPDAAAARQQLRKLASSLHFTGAPRLFHLLRYVVEARLAEGRPRITQKQIAVDVFGRDEGFDPVIDSVVRVEMSRLRSKLRDYYLSDGTADRIRFRLPKGGYIPEIEKKPEIEPPLEGQTPDGPALAVLPFANIGGDPEEAYFADGVTEDLITELGRVPGLLVFARQSTFRYRGSDIPLPRIGGELGASHVLDGSIRRAGNRIRISAQLVEVPSQCQLWAEHYDLLYNDLFSVQDEVAQRIASALSIKLERPANPNSRARDARMQAHDLTLQGNRRQLLYDRRGNDEAVSLYERAIAVDPEFAPVHARLAIALTYRGIMAWSSSPPEEFARAETCARAAVRLEPDLPLAHAAFGWACYWNGKADDAIAAGRHAVEIGPSDATAHLFCSMSLASHGHPEEALRIINRAALIDPADPYYFPRAYALFYCGKYEDALELCKCSIACHPTFVPSRVLMAACCGHLGLVKEGLEQLKSVREVSPRHLVGTRNRQGQVMQGLRKLQGFD